MGRRRADRHADRQPAGRLREHRLDDRRPLVVGDLGALPQDAQDGHAIDPVTDHEVGQRSQARGPAPRQGGRASGRCSIRRQVDQSRRASLSVTSPPRAQGSSWRSAKTTLAGRSASRRMYHGYHASPYAIRTRTVKPSAASLRCWSVADAVEHLDVEGRPAAGRSTARGRPPARSASRRACPGPGTTSRPP